MTRRGAEDTAGRDGVDRGVDCKRRAPEMSPYR
jgi:hypothetical protein